MNITKAEKKEKQPETLYFGDRGLILGSNTEIEDWNKNVCVFGSNENYLNVVKANILQEQESIIVTDYKGQIFQDLGRTLIMDNYIVHVLNLNSYSTYDTFNPFYYVRECVMEEYREQLIDAIVESIVEQEKDLKEEKKELLNAIIYFFYEETDRYFNMLDILDFLLDAESEYLYDIEFQTASEQGRAIAFYENFRTYDSDRRKKVILDLVMHLHIFSADFVKAFTSTESLQLDLLHDEKCAIFIVTGDSTFPMSDILISCIYRIARIMRNQDAALRKKLNVPTVSCYPIRYYLNAPVGSYELSNDQSYTYVTTGMEGEEPFVDNADIVSIMGTCDYTHLTKQYGFDLPDEFTMKEDQVLICHEDQAILDEQYQLSEHPFFQRTEHGRIRFFDPKS